MSGSGAPAVQGIVDPGRGYQDCGGITTVAVLGCGASGAGIAQVFARAGHDVIVYESEASCAHSGSAKPQASAYESDGREPSTDQPRKETDARISAATDVSELAAADLVVEAVCDDLAVKSELLSRVARVVGDRVPLVTTTSVLSITEIAATLPAQGRVAGLHFVEPVQSTRTVEVIPGLETDGGTVDLLVQLVASLDGKEPVVVKDRPGFLVNALLLPYLNDAIQELDDDLATADDLDVALELGLGYKAGPLAMLDSIGLDVHLRATEAAHSATGDPRYAPPPLLRRMVAAGRLGAASGKGFRTAPKTPPATTEEP